MTSQEIIDVHAVQTEMAGKLADARERLSAATAAADQVAFSAHSGDKAAIAALAKHNAEAATASAEARSLEAALSEAQRRVAAAEAAAIDEREREKAERALEAAAAFHERGERVVAALEALVSELMGFERDYRELLLLDYAPTSTWSLAQVNIVLSLHTRLQGLGLHVRPLQHHEKKDLLELVSAWETNIRARAKARLNRNAKPRRAA